MPVLRAALMMAMVATAARPAWARAEQPEAQVERLAAEAVQAYRGADYNRAVELLTKAYEIRQVPALLYNMAKAYDKLGDVEHASDAYRRYVDSLDADPKLKAKAEARLTALEAERRKREPVERPPEVKPGRDDGARAPAIEARTPVAAQHAAPTAAELREQRRQQQLDSRRHARYAALGLGLTTVALGATAIGLSVNALSLQSQWQSQYGGDEDARRALKNSALLRAGIADGFYALTAVAAGVTAYFLYRGFRHEPAAPSLALAVSPAGAYVASEWHF